jgi:hypothetical protein
VVPRRLALLGAVCVAVGALSRPAAAQGITEVGAQAMLTTANPTALFAGPTLARRVGRRDRLAFGLGLGGADGQVAGRGEAMWQFLLSPEAEGRPGVYLGAGLAASVTPAWRGWVVATAGVDWSPGGRSGWMAEVGVGGGVRVVLGYRWRRGGTRK